MIGDSEKPPSERWKAVLWRYMPDKEVNAPSASAYARTAGPPEVVLLALGGDKLPAIRNVVGPLAASAARLHRFAPMRQDAVRGAVTTVAGIVSEAVTTGMPAAHAAQYAADTTSAALDWYAADYTSVGQLLDVYAALLFMLSAPRPIAHVITLFNSIDALYRLGGPQFYAADMHELATDLRRVNNVEAYYNK